MLLWWLGLQAGAQVRPEIMALAGRLPAVSVTTQPYTNGGIHLRDSLALVFQQSATAAELLELTEDLSPPVRTTALFALIDHPQRDSLGLHLLVPRHFHDTAAIRLEVWGESRTHLDVKVGEVFLQTIGGYTNSLFWLNDNFRPDSTAQAWLDSVFLCSPTHFSTFKNSLLWNWKPLPTMYPCIGQLVEAGQDNQLPSFLAKYQREEDIGLLTDHLPDANMGWNSNRWQPFQFFRHPKMFAFLQSEMDGGWLTPSYQRMVAQYKTPESTPAFPVSWCWYFSRKT